MTIILCNLQLPAFCLEFGKNVIFLGDDAHSLARVCLCK